VITPRPKQEFPGDDGPDWRHIRCGGAAVERVLPKSQAEISVVATTSGQAG